METEGLYEFEDGESSVTLDSRQSPMLVVLWRGAPTMPLAQQYFVAQERIFDELHAKQARAIILTRTEKARRPVAHVRRFISQRTKELRPLHAKVIVADAIVITSPLVRVAVAAMAWVDPEMRLLVLPSISEGYDWARQTLIQCKLELPPVLERSA